LSTFIFVFALKNEIIFTIIFQTNSYRQIT
jgi:hypothetical protein